MNFKEFLAESSVAIKRTRDHPILIMVQKQVLSKLDPALRPYIVKDLGYDHYPQLASISGNAFLRWTLNTVHREGKNKYSIRIELSVDNSNRLHSLKDKIPPEWEKATKDVMKLLKQTFKKVTLGDHLSMTAFFDLDTAEYEANAKKNAKQLEAALKVKDKARKLGFSEAVVKHVDHKEYTLVLGWDYEHNAKFNELEKFARDAGFFNFCATYSGNDVVSIHE